MALAAEPREQHADREASPIGASASAGAALKLRCGLWSRRGRASRKARIINQQGTPATIPVNAVTVVRELAGIHVETHGVDRDSAPRLSSQSKDAIERRLISVGARPTIQIPLHRDMNIHHQCEAVGAAGAATWFVRR